MNNLQIRYPVAPSADLDAFHFNGELYIIIGRSPRRDMIPGLCMHRQEQHRAQTEDGRLFDVYVYYYHSLSDGCDYAVVDDIRPVGY